MSDEQRDHDDECDCEVCMRAAAHADERQRLLRLDVDPDGEAFRGDEAAAYERDQMAEIQRDLK